MTGSASKRQKVESTTMGDDDTATAMDMATSSAMPATSATDVPAPAGPATPVVAVRDLESLTLAAPQMDPTQLLAIIAELRQTAGAKAVNTAIAKVMRQQDNASKPTSNAVLPPTAATAPLQHERVKKVKKPAKKSRGREFVMDNYVKRSLAIKFLYVGERFAGFARQDHMEDTVERYLIDALVRTKLIEGDIEQANYSRCGRTDRGVSAFGQVIAVTLRSNLPVNSTLVDHVSIDDVRPGSAFRIELPNGDVKTINEVDYPTHINRALPIDIRVYSVVSVPPAFSARFDCTGRMYRYFFVQNDMDIAQMQLAAQCLVGKHDFRNFCRIDTNVHTFERSIASFAIIKCDDFVAADPRQQMYRCEVYGRAFLWHQVRCMVQLLFLIGMGKESPELIPQLLDVAQTPRKPQYDMASDIPLVLHDCFFDNVTFDYSPLALHQVHDQLTHMWEAHCIKGAILRSNLDAIGAFPVTFARVTSELDHYAPTLAQLLTARGCGPSSAAVANVDDDAPTRATADGVLPTATTATFAWKNVPPLLPLASRRRTIPLLTRDTGDSVDEKKHKVLERKRRRREIEQLEAQEVASASSASVVPIEVEGSNHTATDK